MGSGVGHLTWMCADYLSWYCPAWTLALGLLHAQPPLGGPLLHAFLPCDRFEKPQCRQTIAPLLSNHVPAPSP